MSFDQATAGDAFAAPGMDTRQWISMGTVDAEKFVDGEKVDPVVFDDDFGPLVNVTLQPSGLPARCRVAIGATGACGNGESEYSPFVGGDEVVVAVPEGFESTGCVIIGRLNNGLDKFPAESVAGQDPTRNRFAFRRRRTPFVEEFATTWMTRVASHGGFFLISESGTVTIRDGSKGALQMGPDIFGYVEGGREVGSEATPSPTALFQLDLTNRRVILQMDDAQLMLSSSSASASSGDPPPGDAALNIPGGLSLAFGNNQPAEHVATIEAVVALLETIFTAISVSPVPGPAIGSTALTALNAALAAGGAAITTTAASLATGLPIAAASPKPPPVGGVQLLPRLGAVSFRTG